MHWDFSQHDFLKRVVQLPFGDRPLHKLVCVYGKRMKPLNLLRTRRYCGHKTFSVRDVLYNFFMRGNDKNLRGAAGSSGFVFVPGPTRPERHAEEGTGGDAESS